MPQAGHAPAPAAPAESDLRAPERLAIDYADAADWRTKSAKALKALAANQPAIWKALRAQGIFRGHGPAPKVAFLYTGQGSQYVNMLQPLRAAEPIVAETFAEADRVMTPLLGKPLSEYIFVDGADAEAVAKAEEDLRQTAITQPAVLATDMALTRLLAAYGIEPDMTMGHSLGEYGALVAAGGLPFEDALEAVSARGREMTRVSLEDNGRMAAVFAPLDEIERILKTIDGYVVIANINSEQPGGHRRREQGGRASHGNLPESRLQRCAACRSATLSTPRLWLRPASRCGGCWSACTCNRRALPIVANVNGEFYPTGPDVVPQMLDMLAQQVASPVQFVKGLRHTVRCRRARLRGSRAEESAAGICRGRARRARRRGFAVHQSSQSRRHRGLQPGAVRPVCGGIGPRPAKPPEVEQSRQLPRRFRTLRSAEAVPSHPRQCLRPQRRHGNGDRYLELGHMFADVLERGWQITTARTDADQLRWRLPERPWACPEPSTSSMMPTSAASCGAINSSMSIPTRFRRAMLDKHITRLVKSDNGGDVRNHQRRGGRDQAGGPRRRLRSGKRIRRFRRALGSHSTAPLAWRSRLGIDALRDAGIPLVMRYKTTSKGTQLPDRWGLPDALRDDTGVIFASAFPGYDSFADEMSRYLRRPRSPRAVGHAGKPARPGGRGEWSFRPGAGDRPAHRGVARRHRERSRIVFDRRFLFRVLSMGHSQFAEFIGARGPNTQINAACASTTQAVSLAEDWIRAGRCRRVVVISADDVTSDHLIEWFGAGFLASGAAATDEVVEDAAIPFDRRRHGMIIGMGAAALVVESAEAARERGIQPICEVLSAVTANSAFHGTRLDVQHIGQVMENLVAQAEARSGIHATRSRRRRFSFPTKPTRPRAAAAPRRRSTRCAASSATLRTRS